MFGTALKKYQKGNPIYNSADTLLTEFEKHNGRYQKKMREYENRDNREHSHRHRHRDRERRRDKRQNSVQDEKKQKRSQPNDPQSRKRKLSELKKLETHNTNNSKQENGTTQINKLNEQILTESNLKKKKRKNQDNNNSNVNNLDESAAYSKLNELMPQSYQMDQKFDVGENFQDIQNIIQQAFSEKFGSPEYIQKLTMAFKLTKEIQNTLLMLCYEVLPFPMALLELVDSVDPPFPSFNKNEFGSFSFEFEELKNLSKKKAQKNNQPNEIGDQSLIKDDQDNNNNDDDDDEVLFSQKEIIKLGLEINKLSELNKVKITNFIANKLYNDDDKDVDSEENMMQVDLFTMSTRKLIQLKKFVKKIIKLEEKKRITKKEEKELEEIDKQLEKLN